MYFTSNRLNGDTFSLFLREFITIIVSKNSSTTLKVLLKEKLLHCKFQFRKNETVIRRISLTKHRKLNCKNEKLREDKFNTRSPLMILSSPVVYGDLQGLSGYVPGLIVQDRVTDHLLTISHLYTNYLLLCVSISPYALFDSKKCQRFR